MLWVLIPIATQPIAIAISTQRSLFKEGDLDELCDYNGSVLDAVILRLVNLVPPDLSFDLWFSPLLVSSFSLCI